MLGASWAVLAPALAPALAPVLALAVCEVWRCPLRSVAVVVWHAHGVEPRPDISDPVSVCMLAFFRMFVFVVPGQGVVRIATVWARAGLLAHGGARAFIAWVSSGAG